MDCTDSTAGTGVQALQCRDWSVGTEVQGTQTGLQGLECRDFSAGTRVQNLSAGTGLHGGVQRLECRE